VQMHVPGAYADVEVEAEARLYIDDDYNGQTITTQQAARSDELRVYGGFAAKNGEFIESLKTGVDVCSSPFRDAVKTMRICETILAQAHQAGV